MRRNCVTLIKYAAVAIICMIFGPLSFRMLFTSQKASWSGDGRAMGLPVAPLVDKHNHRHEPTKRYFNEPVKKALEPGALIDWHDYKQIALDLERTGPGEQGAAVILSAEEETKKDELYKVNGFNGFASDKIALDRALKDIRHPNCHHRKYLAALPTVSVVIPFHNEHWSTLLRSAESILHHSPPQLLKEVILTDDFSTKAFLGKPLDDYVAAHYGGRVKVLRAPKREGLIRTRLLGARQAVGEVLIFLDSHIEVNVNWLPPLLDPIARNRTTVMCPYVDVIDFETFAYRAQDEGARGAFDWQFFYKRLALLPDHAAHPEMEFESPVMAGGLFAIDANWFWKLGGYDPGLEIWGGEQYELSFKIWQCGGKMLDAPCSRVGHIYRKFAPFPNAGVGDYVGRNYVRVAEVWMDEYKEYLYKRRPHYRSIDPGDLTEQKAVRTRLRCKSFKWFMEVVAFDLPKTYPMVEPLNFAEGELRNSDSSYCLDTKFKSEHSRFGIDKCIKGGDNVGGEQQFALSWHHDLRTLHRIMCFDVSQSLDRTPVILYNCHHMKGNQRWKYNVKTEQLLHPISRQCLDCDHASLEIFMTACDARRPTQRWRFGGFTNSTLLAADFLS